MQLFKQLWENPQLEGSLYLKEEVEFKGHKFNNWLLVIVLLQKNTELLKVFLQKQNATFSTRDFHSFVNFCLQDHHAYQHQLKNLLTLYPTPSIFQQLSNGEKYQLVKDLLTKPNEKDLAGIVTNILCSKPYLSYGLIAILDNIKVGSNAELAKAALMNLTEEDLVHLTKSENETFRAFRDNGFGAGKDAGVTA